MTCSLIITTYNWKEALELVLLSALKQSELPDEIIIADDGSSTSTKELVETFAKSATIPIVHSWQEDDGFRAAQSRNRAIAKASGEYIILIDGDMILHRDFIKDHLNFAKEGYFVQGSRVLLGKHRSNELLESKKTNISFFDNDIKNRKNSIHSDFLSTLFSHESTKLSGIKTCNMGFFREDCYKVNGFNNDFIGWGREDSEFIVRIMNSAIKRHNLKFNAIAYHIWHNENTRESLESNDNLLENCIKNSLTFCTNGIDKY